jgi:branched-chain amino acid transport system ATP-binding protein
MSGLKVENLEVHHGAIRAVNSLSFEIQTGQLAAVIGANGAGKTTLLRALSGLKPVHSGSAHWQGKSMLHRKPEDLVRAGIVHVCDGISVIPELTVKENLALGGLWRKDKKDVALATSEALDLFPRLGERLSQSANTLSGGERQMLAIGRALVARPALLLLDEPSLGLAPLVVEQIFQAIKSLRDRLNLTVVLVEQNAMSALRISDIGIIINLGSLVRTGPAQELINNPALRAAYLGY